MKLGPCATSPRFQSIFARCEDEVRITQRRVTTQTLRPLCVVVSQIDGFQRRATDAEIADPANFKEAKELAAAVGYQAMRAHAKRLIRFYGLKDKYVNQSPTA